MRPKLQGLIAAPHTPFRADGSFAPDIVAEQARWLASSGVVGVFVGGTTGEWPSLTVGERRELFEAWAAHRGELLFIAHVGHNCQRDAMELARAAVECGAQATSAIAPSFFRPQSGRECADYYAPIAAAARDLPFFVYHIPGMTGIRVSPDEQLAACLAAIPNMAGMKFTDPDLYAYGRCVTKFGDRCDLVWGVDEILLGALAYGATAAVGSTYNYAAPLYRAMIDAHERGDRARATELGLCATQLVEALIDAGVLAGGKALMARRGIDCGPPRPPVAPLTAEQRERLLDRVDAVDALADHGAVCHGAE
ncbi:MAG: dihydrodipicolinate synthase family protein [Planctomycetes bacterium]|nr:dihydrodipicolinate synthase family protein [Planctomycetota bacterium]